jgi:GYF domain 2/Domain of unknown function (DUF4190)
MFKVLGSDQQVYGPVTAAQLRQWMSEGRVHPATLLQLEGTAEWKPVSSFAEFAVPPVVNMPQPQVRESNNNMAMWALICGILCNFCCCGGILFGIIGLVLSIIVLSRPEDYPGENHRQLALIGLVLCIIGLVWRCFLPLLFQTPGSWRFHHFRIRGY